MRGAARARALGAHLASARPGCPSAFRVEPPQHGRSWFTGPSLVYTPRAVAEVKARCARWLALSPALRRANRTGDAGHYVLDDASGQAVRAAGLAETVVRSVHDWWTRSPPLACEPRPVPASHPAYDTYGGGCDGGASMGLYATRGFARGAIVCHYDGVMCVEGEALACAALSPARNDYTYDVDADEETAGRLRLEGALFFGGGATPCLGGMANGQKGLPAASVNMKAVTVLGVSCCASCPPFVHPHIFFVTNRDVRADEELVLDYGPYFFDPPDEMPATVPVTCRGVHGTLDTVDFLVRPASGGDPLTPPEFERAAGGGACKNWRTSFKVGAVDGFKCTPCRMPIFLAATDLNDAALRASKRWRTTAKRPLDEEEAATAESDEEEDWARPSPPEAAARAAAHATAATAAIEERVAQAAAEATAATQAYTEAAAVVTLTEFALQTATNKAAEAQKKKSKADEALARAVQAQRACVAAAEACLISESSRSV